MKNWINKEKTTSSPLEEEYHRVLIEGPEQLEIPPFQLLPKTQREIRTAIPPKPARMALFAAFSPQLRISFSAAFVVLLVGMFLFISHWPSEKCHVKTFEIDGQTYQVIWLDPAAAFNPKDLNVSNIPALQGDNHETKGYLRQQLGFLTDDLATALKKNLASANWEGVRDTLKVQEMELPTTPPKHLVISERLIELLDTDVREVELWIIQTNASVLLFTMAK